MHTSISSPKVSHRSGWLYDTDDLKWGGFKGERFNNPVHSNHAYCSKPLDMHVTNIKTVGPKHHNFLNQTVLRTTRLSACTAHQTSRAVRVALPEGCGESQPSREAPYSGCFSSRRVYTFGILLVNQLGNRADNLSREWRYYWPLPLFAVDQLNSKELIVHEPICFYEKYNES